MPRRVALPWLPLPSEAARAKGREVDSSTATSSIVEEERYHIKGEPLDNIPIFTYYNILVSLYVYITIGTYIYISIFMLTYISFPGDKAPHISSYIYSSISVPFPRPLFFTFYNRQVITCFLLCKSMAVLSDAKHRAKASIELKLFWKAFRKYCIFGYSEKLSTQLFGVLTLPNHHLLMHVKRLMMTR